MLTLIKDINKYNIDRNNKKRQAKRRQRNRKRIKIEIKLKICIISFQISRNNNMVLNLWLIDL